MNFNISKLVYLGIHTYQRNFGSHVTVRIPARPSVRRHHRVTNVKWHFVLRVGACNLCKRVSPDQYCMTLSQIRVSTRGQVFYYYFPLTSYLLLIDRRFKFNVLSSNCFSSIEPLPKTSYGLPLI